MGLGADRSLMLQTEKDKKNGSIEDEENVMKRGCHCIIVVGRHNGFYGTVSKFNTAHIFKFSLSINIQFNHFHIKM